VAGAALPGRLIWRSGRVVELIEETARARTIVLELPGWPGHRAGQHVDLRLTAADGYQAQRSYSIASAPEEEHLALTVELIADGEVSPYLVSELRRGDELELRGPIGGYFVWERSDGGPLTLLAGGSGIVPLRAIARHWASGPRAVAAQLLYSIRTLEDAIYRDELERLAHDAGLDVQLALTRGWPDDWTGRRGRIDRALLAELVAPPGALPLVYACGPNAFVEAVSQGLVELGHEPGRIRTERFGPSG